MICSSIHRQNGLRGKKAFCGLRSCVSVFGSLAFKKEMLLEIKCQPYLLLGQEWRLNSKKKSCKSLYKMKIVPCKIVLKSKVKVMWLDCRKIISMSWIFCFCVSWRSYQTITFWLFVDTFQIRQNASVTLSLYDWWQKFEVGFKVLDFISSSNFYISRKVSDSKCF